MKSGAQKLVEKRRQELAKAGQDVKQSKIVFLNKANEATHSSQQIGLTFSASSIYLKQSGQVAKAMIVLNNKTEQISQAMPNSTDNADDIFQAIAICDESPEQLVSHSQLITIINDNADHLCHAMPGIYSNDIGDYINADH
jgi:hypothetical protein